MDCNDNCFEIEIDQQSESSCYTDEGAEDVNICKGTKATAMPDEELGGGIEILSVCPSPLKADDRIQTCRPHKRHYVMAALTVLALIVVGVTAPLLHQSLQKKSDDGTGGATVDFSDYPPALPTATDDATNDLTASNNAENHETSEASSFSARQSKLPNVPFETINLPFFTQEITRGYSNQTQFEDALTEAAKFLVNKIVLRSLGNNSMPMVGSGSSGGWGANTNAILGGNDNVFSFRGATAADESAPQEFRDVTDYETNNQEKGIDEADLMKADAEYVYAAYDDYLLVWNKDGNQVAQVKMPEVDTDGESSSSTQGSSIFSSPISDSSRKPHIEALLLVGEHLVVVVSDYGSSGGSGARNVLMDHHTMQIRTYKTSTISADKELELVGTKTIHGRFLDARSIGNQVHVVTTSSIDTYKYLMQPLERYSNFPDLSDDEYVERVKFQAMEKFIPQFVQELTSQLSVQDRTGEKSLPNLLQVNRWQSDSSSGSNTDARAQVDAQMFMNGVVHSVAFVTSLDVTVAPLVDSSGLSQELITTVSSFLAPSQHIHLYASQSKLVLATRAWSWNAQVEAAEEVTHLVVLNVNNNDDEHDQNDDNDTDSRYLPSTSFHSVGTVRGYLLNPYSLDIMNNELRVATTIAKRWWFKGGPLISTSVVQMGSNQHSSRVSDRSAEQEEEGVVEESITENLISVLDLNDASKKWKEVQLGEKDEIIMAVRFFDKIAYCVTFRHTDPFYVVDMETVTILGQFKLNGFSNYLHPLNHDNTLLVGIGQNVTDEGVVNGFMITVFNTTDPTQPKDLVSYTVDDSSLLDGEATQSVAQWDYKAFRYVDGKLIVPMNIVTYTTEGSTDDALIQTVLGAFEGFVVFNVGTDTIDEQFRVSHADLGCQHCGYLAPRSFVYGGNIMTAQGNIVSSTNLYNTEENWAFHVEIEGEEAICCY